MHLIFRKSTRPLLFVLIVLLAAFAPGALRSAHGQGATTGAIAGTVADSGGALLPNAAVVIKSVETGATRTVKTNASGEYQVSELQPGSYTVTFTADGFQSAQQTGVLVTVGGLTNVSPKLAVGSVSNTVEVSGESPLLHTQSNDISTTIDQATIDNLPINGRRFSDFALLTPGVVSNSDGYGLLSFRGISFLLNNNTVDGADDNQAYFAEARGRTRASYAISQAAVQEFQVNTSNYSAQYGRSAGGVINTVTKSGTNKLHGELFFYDRDNSLGGATNPYTLLTVKNSAGNYNSVPYKPTDWRKQWGFGVGGPLIKDKLFWFYAYDQSRRNYPGTSRPTDPNDFFAPSDATLPSNETCTPGAFSSTALTLYTEGDYNACAIAASYGVSFQAGSAYYQQGLGILQSFIGTVPRRQDQVINMPKLDWQINQRNHLSLLYSRLRYSGPNGLYQPTTEDEGRSGWGDDFIKEDFGITRLTTVISNSMVNEALVQYGRDFEYTYQNGPLPNEVPMSQNAYGDAASTQIGYYFNDGIYAGSNPDLPRYADPDERRLQLLDSVTWSHGGHVAKAGLEFNKVSDYVNNLYNGNGSYSYDYSYTFIADYLNLTEGLGGAPAHLVPTTSGPYTFVPGYNQLFYDYGQEFGNPVGEIATREYAGYATDDWRITPRLTLTLGVRYEYEYVPPSPFVNTGNPALAAALNVLKPMGYTTTALPQTADRPDDRNNVGPRFGFAWNIFGDNRTILRGGYGLYYGRIINSNILQTYEESGSPNAQISISTLHPAQYTSSSIQGGCAPTWPNVFPNTAASLTSIYSCIGAESGLSTSTVAYLDPHMQNPEVHELDLAIEQDLGGGTAFSIQYMASLGRELPSAIDTNFNASATTVLPYAIASAAPSTGTTSYAINTAEDPSYSSKDYPIPPQTGAYVVLPHGGAKEPLNPGETYKTKVFLVPQGGTTTRPDPAYYEILDVKSSVNSSYNALAVQLNHRYRHGFLLGTNYTWSHALDENPYESTVVPSYTMLDPTNPRADYGNSDTDVRQRYVGYLVYQPETNFHGLKNEVLGGWRIAPLVQMQTGLPFSAGVSASGFTSVSVADGVDGCPSSAGCTESLAGSGVNGAGSSADRVPFIARNTYNYPKTAVFDLRLGKNFYPRFLPHLEDSRLEIFAELFNVMNHQNITGITTEAYTLSSENTNSVPTLSPYPGFGQYTNANSNYVYSPRQLQVSARFHF